MAYQTGIVADHFDILDTLATFAAANGWTVDALRDYTSSPKRRELILHQGSSYFGLGATFKDQYSRANTGSRADVVGIYLRGCTGFSTGDAWYQQPGVSNIEAAANDLPETSMAYWLFGGSDYLHMVIRPVAGVYKHIGIGRLDKGAASYTGGEYAVATFWQNYSADINDSGNGDHHLAFDAGAGSQLVADDAKWSHVRADLDGGSPEWRAFAELGAGSLALRALGAYRDFSDGDFYNDIVKRTPNDLNGQVILHPIRPHALLANSNYKRLGQVPDLRLVYLTNVEPEAQLVIGSDTWHCFPVIQKNGAAGTPNSGSWGMAFKEVP